MGVPAFFRWLSMRYPKIVAGCVEELQIDVDGTEIPIDATAPNPNGVEFDNLYLDMNGIIHPCTHPEDRPAPTTEREMFDEVERYVDRIMRIVRPRKVLFMAIDGVAPRAKINQQRSRRFRAAKDAQQKADAEHRLVQEWRQNGLAITTADDDGNSSGSDDENGAAAQGAFDSNVITPGTPFMDRLAVALRQFVAARLASDPAWRGLKVLFSDASVPGEGEHKIADFVRRQRLERGYDPATRHVLYGLDADLIMLGLATHEAAFTILREEVQDQRGRGGSGSATKDGGGAGKAEPDEHGILRGTLAELGGRKPFEFVHIHVLREYLECEFRDHMEQVWRQLSAANAPCEANFAFDLERVVDDFVFMCFFVGNDFLPHLPSLEIREGGIDFLVELYKKLVPRVGYITDGTGEPDFDKARMILAEIALREDEVFRARAVSEQRHAAARLRDAKGKRPASTAPAEAVAGVDTDAEANAKPTKAAATATLPGGAIQSAYELKQLLDQAEPETLELGRKQDALASATRRKRARTLEEQNGSKRTAVAGGVGSSGDQKGVSQATAMIAEKKTSGTVTSPAAAQKEDPAVEHQEEQQQQQQRQREQAEPRAQADAKTLELTKPSEAQKKEFHEQLAGRLRESSEVAEVKDNIKLGEAGWKTRYYENKLRWTSDSSDFAQRKSAFCRKYFEGLLWVMRYYYRGCESWTWYYPYHYAPFASDLVEQSMLSSASIKFERGECFTPLEQLMGVLPAASAPGVLPAQFVKLMRDKRSPIVDFYPEDFELDLNGKRFAWQGIALLPFVDEKRLRAALQPLYDSLSADERQRNELGAEYIFVHARSELGKLIATTLATISSASRNDHSDMSDSQQQQHQQKSVEVPEALSDGVVFGALLPFEPPREADAEYVDVVGVARYEMHAAKPHLCRMLPGAEAPPKVLELADKYEVQSGTLGWRVAKFGPLGVAAKRMAATRGATALELKRASLGGGGAGFGGVPSSMPNTAAAAATAFQRAPPPPRPQYLNAAAAAPTQTPVAAAFAQPRWMQQAAAPSVTGAQVAPAARVAFGGISAQAPQQHPSAATHQHAQWQRYSPYYQTAAAAGIPLPSLEHGSPRRALGGQATEAMRHAVFAKRTAPMPSGSGSAPAPFGPNSSMLFANVPNGGGGFPGGRPAAQARGPFGFGPSPHAGGAQGPRR